MLHPVRDLRTIIQGQSGEVAELRELEQS
ncbi:hypothetical protein ANCDUO_17382 [Ancylostoma duodenale]|uniref:Uncharacterized protein n=1 Tax=Ancylostoma duodenale TaxID=51022 RepID=A0A0C2CRV8_9BILA|nr:hypothetical protein ANCDUO_17382 [Ancylostoma duodenale]